jgi:hypothetical protein
VVNGGGEGDGEQVALLGSEEDMERQFMGVVE